MTTDLEPRYAVNPATGERFDLSRPAEELAEAMGAAQQLIYELDGFKKRIGREILEAMDKRAEWTLHAGQFKLTGRSPEPSVTYDEVKLRAALSELVEQGLIDPEAAQQAVKVEVTYKPQAGAIKKLHKLGGKVSEAIDAAKKEPDPEWARSRTVRVSVVN
jgi:hypothetical protein